MIFSCAVNVVLAIVFGVLVGLNWDKLLDNYFRFSNSETPQSVIGNATVSGKAITIRDSVCFSCDYLGSGVSVNETLYEEIVTTDCKHKLCCIKDKVIHDFVIAVSGIVCFLKNIFIEPKKKVDTYFTTFAVQV